MKDPRAEHKLPDNFVWSRRHIKDVGHSVWCIVYADRWCSIVANPRDMGDWDEGRVEAAIELARETVHKHTQMSQMRLLTDHDCIGSA